MKGQGSVVVRAPRPMPEGQGSSGELRGHWKARERLGKAQAIQQRGDNFLEQGSLALSMFPKSGQAGDSRDACKIYSIFAL